MPENKTTPPLTDTEIQALRDLVQASQFRKWLVQTVRGVSIWIVGVLAAWGAVKSLLTGLLK